VGTLDEKEISKATNLKSERELLAFEKTPRKQVLEYITDKGPATISNMAKDLNLEPRKVRFEALRLAQLMEVEMKVDPGMDEPIFTLICD
jgi:hypothetical protein